MQTIQTTRLVLAVVLAAASAPGSSFVQGYLFFPNYTTGGDHPLTVSASGTDSGGLFETAYTTGGTVKVDMAEGTMKGKINGNNASAVLRMEIREEFRISGPPTTGRIPIVFEFDVEGFGDVNPFSEGYGLSTMTAYLYATISRYGEPFLPDGKYVYLWSIDKTGPGGTELWISEPTGNVKVNSASKASFDVTLKAISEVMVYSSGLSDVVDLSFFVEGSAGGTLGGGGALNMFDTGRARVILPEGYSAVSKSGVFLTKDSEEPPPLGEVPEPAAWTAAAMGLVAILAKRPSRLD
jgi:hypothetical protein